MKARVRLFLIAVTALMFAASFWSGGPTSAQHRDAFKHSAAAHKKQSCNFCHKIPTPNWQAARGFPDTAKMPAHASCTGCHAKDFFNPPAICAGCHVNPGPRGAALFPFPVRSRSHEFATIFPHDKHQNIIASNFGSAEVGVAHFLKAGFSLPDNPKPQFNNCVICHQPYTSEPKFAIRKLLKGEQPLAEAAQDAFAPKAEFFRNNPDSHASCFSCHYQNQEPIRTNCAGCHRLTTPYTETQVVSRYSIKYDHRQKDHAAYDCTSCHVRITQNSDVAAMKDADVPILTCVTCHEKKINEELVKRDASIKAKQPAFQCTYCHSSEIGRYTTPASHTAQ